MTLEELKLIFPNLKQDRLASKAGNATKYYNCIAYAIGDFTNISIWPIDNAPMKYFFFNKRRTFWPTDLKKNESLDTFIELFKKFGYEKCDDDTYDKNFRKIAIYCIENDVVTHAALQYNDKLWLSKLGFDILLMHQIHSLEDTHYGKVACFMRRPITIKAEQDIAIVKSYLK